MSDPNIDDELPALQLAEDARIKKAFDPHIASIVLRPKTNNPSEGYGLAASVTLGSEIVEIPVDDKSSDPLAGREVFEFRIQIFKAELILDTVDCALDHTHEVEKLAGGSISSSASLEQSAASRSTKIKLDSGDLIESLTGAKVGFEHEFSGPSNEVPKHWFEVTALDDCIIQFASMGDEPVPLSGRLLDEFAGWRIIPRHDGPSAVVGRVRVRESWIELIDPRPVGRMGIWTKRLLDLFGGTSKRATFRKSAFQLLLRHLVAEGLQSSSDTRDATLAADSVIVDARTAALSKLEFDDRESAFDFAGRAITRFLQAPAGKETDALLQLGVPQESVERLVDRYSIAIGEEFEIINVESEVLDQLVDLYVDSVATRIKEEGLAIEDFSVEIVGSIFGDEDVLSQRSRKQLRRVGIVLNKTVAQGLLRKVQSPAAITYILGSEELRKFRHQVGKSVRYDLTLRQLAEVVADEDYVAAFLENRKDRFSRLIKNYTDRAD
ncbi:hypothetical protein [Erythrobacter sp. F6033]|uniref:hypothetical protein n=1 Tax=Erythrobacter sp. F6033 TaxID=2926401 RepID=UPI001FF455B4|nr:hypothetical protein [Erythrobacter sp. F6033]MCK0127528.1 hypothetical protein [Erythrobacter sp. F6033]